MSDILTDLFLALSEMVAPLRERFGSLEAVEYLFYRYGWEITLDQAGFEKITQSLAFGAPLNDFLSAAEAIRNSLSEGGGGELGAAQVATLVSSGRTLLAALAKLQSQPLATVAQPLSDPAFWENIGEQLLDDLLEEYLRLYQPSLYLVLRVGGVIHDEAVQSSAPFTRAYTRTSFDWDQLSALIEDPMRALARTYKWGVDGGVALDHVRLFASLAAVLRAVHVSTRPTAPALRPATLPQASGFEIPADAGALRVIVVDAVSPHNQTVYQIGLELFAARKAADSVVRGLVLGPMARGGAGGELPLGAGLVVRWQTTANADAVIGVAMFPEGIDLIHGDLVAGASLEIAGTGNDPYYLVGNAASARLELYCPSLRLAVAGTAGDPELTLRLSATAPGNQPGCQIVIPLDSADSFVKDAARQNQINFSFAPDLVWSSKSGFTFNGNPHATVNLPLAIGIGPVTLTGATISLGANPDPSSGARGWALKAGATLTGKLGPIKFVIDQLGFVCAIVPYRRADLLALPPGGNPPALGTLDVDLRFMPPQGIGVEVDAAVVSGGGFLAHAGDEYSGALDLTVGEVAVKAFGVVQTKLPGGAAGYSFMVALSAEFSPPLELPFGFSLDGVGGIVGVNRTISVDAVETALWGHHLDGLLFPKDPIAAAPQLVSALDGYFPDTPGRYVFGPLAKIGWANNVVVGEVALLLELPEPLKLLLLGEIEVGVPHEKPQLELHISFAGGLDFGKRLAFFDAALHDSRIESYPISGDLAFRYGWAGDGVFALAIGGFNPHFQPPAAFPVLKRLSITIGSSVAQIQASAYLALTSNTLQFGARAELTAGGGGFNVHGWIGFDALCERHPLAFAFDLSAGVDLRHGDSVLASVHLDGHLSGPSPWHIAGKASLSLLFFDVSVHFDKTWGQSAGALPLPDPLPLLLAALADRASFAGLLPSGVHAVASMQGVPTDAGAAVLLEPAGSLRIAQRVMPLGQPISRFGGAALGRTLQLTIDAVSVFGVTVANPPATTEEFAPAQFFDLSDAQKLSLPSFSRFVAGVEVGANAVDIGSGARTRAVMTPLVYDTTIIDAPAMKRPGPLYPLSGGRLAAITRGAPSLGRGLDRYAPAPGARAGIDLAPDRWVVAGTADLKMRADVAGDGSKLGTFLALERFLARHPDQRGKLQVVLAEEAA